MNIKEARRRTQAVALFFNLHTLARNVRNYVQANEKGEPVSEEMRRLDACVREINRHDGRKIMRRILNEIKVD